MCLRASKHVFLYALAVASTLAAPSAQAQEAIIEKECPDILSHWRIFRRPRWMPEPCPTAPDVRPDTKPDSKQETPTPPAPEMEPTLMPVTMAALGDSTLSYSPNMIGNLLGAGRSLTFFYQRSMGSVFINGTGSTNIVNPSVAENNSPIPSDRIAFKFNYFNNALRVTGESSQPPVLDPTLGTGFNGAPRFRGLTATQSFSVYDYTFSFEKTFLDGLGSVEVRLPFAATVDSTSGPIQASAKLHCLTAWNVRGPSRSRAAACTRTPSERPRALRARCSRPGRCLPRCERRRTRKGPHRASASSA